MQDFQTGNRPQDVHNTDTAGREVSTEASPETEGADMLGTALGRALWLVNKVADVLMFTFIAVFMGGIGWIFGDVFFGVWTGGVLGLVVGIGSGWITVRVTNRLMLEATLWLFGASPQQKSVMRQNYRSLL